MTETVERFPHWPDEFTDCAINDVWKERVRQDKKWGTGRILPNATRPRFGGARVQLAKEARYSCDDAFDEGEGTWRHILQEEVCEAFAEDDPEELRKELVQVAAVAVAWIESLDRQKFMGGE